MRQTFGIVGTTVLVLAMCCQGCGRTDENQARINKVLGASATPLATSVVDLGILRDQTQYTPARYEPLDLGFGNAGGGGAKAAGVRGVLTALRNAKAEFDVEVILELYDPDQVVELMEDSSFLLDVAEKLETLKLVFEDKLGVQDAAEDDDWVDQLEIELIDDSQATVQLPVVGALALFGGGDGAELDTTPPSVTFDADIQSLFAQSCIPCHTSDNASGGFIFETFDDVMRGGTSGAVVIAGDPDTSRLWKLVNHEEKPNMPARAAKLDDATLAKIRTWIAEGAAADASGTAMPELMASSLRLERIDGEWRIKLSRVIEADDLEVLKAGVAVINDALDTLTQQVEAASDLDDAAMQRMIGAVALSALPQLGEFVALVQELSAVEDDG